MKAPALAAPARELLAALGPEKVATDESRLRASQHDYWILSHLRARQGQQPAPPACVVRPESAQDVAVAIKAAARARVAVVVRGGGSGVVGGVLVPPGAVVVDMRSMARLLAVDEIALTARVQAGMLGSDYEAELERRGYSTGHFPQSIAVSTVGGWVATRAAGQLSTRYGNIEDLLLACEVVLPSGEIVSTPLAPRSAVGPSLRELFLGSEGTLGVLTELTLRIHPLPEHHHRASFAFPSFAAGLEAQRLIMREGWRPAVLRLYDEVETTRHFPTHAPDGTSLLIVASEGPRALVEAESAALDAIATAHAGERRGEQAVNDWFEHRNQVPPWEVFLDQELLADTIEVAATWDRVRRLYEKVCTALRAVPGMVVASAHSSHSYPQGTCLYFSFLLRPEPFAEAERLYLAAWEAAMEATIDAGGTISHHHGVGRLRTRWLRRELGEGYRVLAALKRALDPKGTMNPGALVTRQARPRRRGNR